MNKDLLTYYNNELYYLREASEKFAEENPQIAQNLSLEGFSCADPYIERLLEGFAYLAARVHYELDSEFSKFTQTLINNIFPDYFLPCPSASVVNFRPDFSNDDIIEGIKIPRGTILNTNFRSSQGTSCTFTTTQDTTLWPISIEEALYSTEDVYRYKPSDIPSPNALLTIELKTEKDINFSQLPANCLDFYLCGASMKVLMGLYEQIFADLLTVAIEFENNSGKRYRLRLTDINSQVEPVGFKEDEALLPCDLRNYNGYRLLKEYFSFPKKFLFFRLSNLQDAFKQINSDKIKIQFFFKNSNDLLESGISRKNFSLYSTPIVNLFEKKLDRLTLTDKKAEFPVHPDNVRLTDYEIIKIETVKGYNSQNQKTLSFRPFYQVSEYNKYSKENNDIYFSCRRKLVANEKKTRLGTDTYLSIVDAHSILSQGTAVEIGIKALCSNRTIPSEIKINSHQKTDFYLNQHYPITGVKFMERPIFPNYSAIKSVSDWAVINHLKVNYKNIIGQETNKSAEILKDLLKLYCPNEKLNYRRQIDGINRVFLKKEMTAIETQYGLSFGTGLLFNLEFDENSFNDSGFFILAYIVHIIIKNSISINTLLKTTVSSNKRGEIKEWKSSLL